MRLSLEIDLEFIKYIPTNMVYRKLINFNIFGYPQTPVAIIILSAYPEFITVMAEKQYSFQVQCYWFNKLTKIRVFNQCSGHDSFYLIIRGLFYNVF